LEGDFEMAANGSPWQEKHEALRHCV
jgi:hypothetical protein